MKRPPPVAVEVHRPMQKAFIDRMKAASTREGWNYGDTLSRFLEAAFRGVVRVTLPPQRAEESEREYEKLMSRCRHREETQDDFAAMFAQVVLALEAEPIDFIGTTFGEIAANEWAGQFFTPYSLSYVMAEMILGDPRELLEKSGRKFITLAEPACGVGGMVLAASKVLKERGIDLARQAHWTMVDVDSRCIHAAYLQTTLCGISADVIHGNTISAESWAGYRTFTASIFPKRISTAEHASTSAAAAAPKVEASRASKSPTRQFELPL